MKVFLAIAALLISTASVAAEYVPPPPKAAVAIFGEYKEGYVIPQHEIRADRYRGWVYPAHTFRPFYVIERVPISRLPLPIACCALSFEQLTAGHLDVVHVYIDTGYRPQDHPEGDLIARYIGPVESLVRTNDGVILLTAPYLGRRATRVGP